jgi:quercetin dioxygenase-like cupin family protein
LANKALPTAGRFLAAHTHQIGSAFGGIAIGIAWATPAAGIFATLVAGPVALDEIDINSHSGEDSVKIKTKGDWECRVVEFRVPPGGDNTFGWHSHPGPKFVMITAGALTKYEADGTSAVYPAGTGFVDAPGDVHTGGNEGDSELKLVAFFLIPLGEAIRTDEEDPLP